MAGYRYTAAAQSGGGGSNTTEIRAGLDRSTAWLGAPRVASRAARASRITRAQRSAKGIRPQPVDVLLGREATNLASFLAVTVPDAARGRSRPKNSASTISAALPRKEQPWRSRLRGFSVPSCSPTGPRYDEEAENGG